MLARRQRPPVRNRRADERDRPDDQDDERDDRSEDRAVDEEMTEEDLGYAGVVYE